MKHRTLVNTTEAYCPLCSDIHPADIEQIDNEIRGNLYCPQGTVSLRLSQNASFFMQTRERSFWTYPYARSLLQKKVYQKVPFTTFVDVTNGCNFSCPICFAAAKPTTKANFISEQDFQQRVDRLKSKGMRAVTLFGGEPTVHPALDRLIAIAKQAGLSPRISTNGFLLGQKKDYVKKLKQAGISLISVQFDTFDKDVHQKMRGNTHIAVKLKAIENIINCKIPLALVVTVTESNLSQVPALLKFALTLGPLLKSVMLQGAVNKGRFEFEQSRSVDREAIVDTIVHSTEFGSDLTHKDFWPVPAYGPKGVYMHPDCVVFTGLVHDNKGTSPISKYIKLPTLFRLLHQTSAAPGVWSKKILPVLYFLKSLHVSAVAILARFMVSTLFPGKIEISSQGKVKPDNLRNDFLLILIESYATARFQDTAKTGLCPSQQSLTDQEVCACEYHSRTIKHEHSRAAVHSRNQL